MNLNLDALKDDTIHPQSPSGATAQAGSGGDDATTSSSSTSSGTGVITNGAAASDQTVQNPLSLVNEHRGDDEGSTPVLKKIELKPIISASESPATPLSAAKLQLTPVTTAGAGEKKDPAAGIKLISLDSKPTAKKDAGVKLLSMDELHKKKKIAAKEEAQKKLDAAASEPKTTLETVVYDEPRLFTKLSRESHSSWEDSKEKYRKYQNKQRQRAVKYGTPVFAVFILAIGITFTMSNNPLVASLSNTPAPNANTPLVAQANTNSLHPAANTNTNQAVNGNRNQGAGNLNVNSAAANQNTNLNAAPSNGNANAKAPVSGAQFVTTVQQHFPKVPEVKQKELETAFTSSRTLTVFEAVKASMITFNIPILVPRISFSRQDAYVEKFAVKNAIVVNKSQLDEPLNDEFLGRIQDVVKKHVTEN